MNQAKNDSLALVVGGLFILALVFATYNYFNKNKENQSNIQKNIEEVQKEANNEEVTGDINGDGASTKSEEAQASTAASSQVASAESKVSTSTAAVWTANDYKKGDIQSGNYTVKSGDTLWEIAEGVYGDGSQWVKILQANSNSVGYLPNGQQALIYAGQTLVLP